MSKTIRNLVFSLLYTVTGFYFAFLHATYLSLGIGALVGVGACLIFLTTKRGKKLMQQPTFISPLPTPNQETVKEIQQSIKELEYEQAHTITEEKEVKIPTPFTSKPIKKTIPFPSILTISYFIIGCLLIFFDQGNKFFTGFLGFAAVTFWFNTWLYWKGEL